MAETVEMWRTERRILPGAVYRLRKAYKMTQPELATAAGMDFTYLSRVERGQKLPSVDMMVKIARGLGVDLDDISYLTRVAEEDAA